MDSMIYMILSLFMKNKSKEKKLSFTLVFFSSVLLE
jgi:hypothetical protein